MSCYIFFGYPKLNLPPQINGLLMEQLTDHFQTVTGSLNRRRIEKTEK